MVAGSRVVAALVACLGVVGVAEAASAAKVAETSGDQRYVVVLDESADRPGVVAKRHAQRQGAKLERVFTRSLDGYAARLSPGEAKAIARQPGVAAVGLDPVGEPAGQGMSTQARRVFAADQDCFPGDNSAVNQSLDIDCTDDVRVDVDIAVLDTPIDPAHPDLNIVSNVDCFANDPTPEDDDPTDHTGCDPGPGQPGYDCGGGEAHGEIVAQPMAAIDNQIGIVGVAPGARIWSVGVADKIPGGPHPCGPFYLSDVIAGVEWVTDHASQIEVANMSMQYDVPTDPAGQALDQALEDAIDTSIDAGVVYVAAAGNMAQPLTGYIPAKYNRLITATAIQDSDGTPGGQGPDATADCNTTTPDQDDTNANATNYGPAATTPWGPGADIAAPGPCTSGAAAMTSGAAALLASTNNPNNQNDVADIRDALLTTANPDNKTNGGWDDETGTSREPLLDLSDESAFDPTLLARHTTSTTFSMLETSALSAIVYGDALNLYARGSDGLLYQKWYSTSTGWSGGWFGLGGPNAQPVTSGSATTQHYNAVNVYARGNDGDLWQKACCFGPEGWTPWWHMGGPNDQPITSSPAATQHYNAVNVYARGTDGDLWQKACCFGPEGWTPWWHMGGPQGEPITSSPAAVTHDNKVKVYARGTDGDLWQRTCCFGPEGWLPWTRFSGPQGDVVASHPIAVVHEGTLHVFVRGHDGSIQETTCCSPSDSWPEWSSVGTP